MIISEKNYTILVIKIIKLKRISEKTEMIQVLLKNMLDTINID